jgi:tetratricopeptide (TPR) repeat protein
MKIGLLRPFLVLCFSLALTNLGAQSLDEVKKLIRNESYPEATKMCDQLLAANTKDGRNFYYKGLAFYKQALEEGISPEAKTGLLNSAKNAFNGALSRNRKDPFAYLGMGLYNIGIDNYTEAKNQLKLALDNGATNVEVLIEMSNAYVDAYNLEAAKGKGKSDPNKKADAMTNATTVLTKATTVSDKNPEVYIALGNVYMAQGVDESAESNYKKALALEGNNIQTHYALSKVYLKQKKYTEAQKELETVKQLDPKFTNAYRDLAELYYKAGKYEYALKEAKEWKNLIGNDKRARARYATLLYLTGHYAEAATALEDISKDSSHYVLKRIWGYSLAEDKKYPEAQKVMDEYFKMVPQGQTVYKDYKYYGMILENLGKHDEAVQNYQKAIDADPSLYELYKNIYTMYYKVKKDWVNAIKYCELYIPKAIENKQSVLVDQYLLGWMYYNKTDNINQAEKVMEDVLAKKPDFTDAISLAASIKAKKDTTGKTAQPYYDRLIKEIHKQNLQEKKKSDLITAYTFMAVYYHLNAEPKDNPRSYGYCNKLLELDPANKTAKQLVDYFKASKVNPIDLTPELNSGK